MSWRIIDLIDSLLKFFFRSQSTDLSFCFRRKSRNAPFTIFPNNNKKNSCFLENMRLHAIGHFFPLFASDNFRQLSCRYSFSKYLCFVFDSHITHLKWEEKKETNREGGCWSMSLTLDGRVFSFFNYYCVEGRRCMQLSFPVSHALIFRQSVVWRKGYE